MKASPVARRPKPGPGPVMKASRLTRGRRLRHKGVRAQKHVFAEITIAKGLTFLR